MQSQRWLFGNDEPTCDPTFARLERVVLGDGAWLDVAREWLSGHARLFEELHDTVAWREEDRRMYDRVVAVPRLFAVLPPGQRPPIVEEMRLVLCEQYRANFDRVSVALYRDGRDSVAWHGDYVARTMQESLVATVSVGAPRKFLVRPTGGGRSWSRAIGCGDLVVMGGTSQRTHQHAIPKVARAEPRIAIMFRPTWDE
jgi:alkylated DNA repair dioxygenase AlkB